MYLSKLLYPFILLIISNALLLNSSEALIDLTKVDLQITNIFFKVNMSIDEHGDGRGQDKGYG